jgi:hypothetical protein
MTRSRQERDRLILFFVKEDLQRLMGMDLDALQDEARAKQRAALCLTAAIRRLHAQTVLMDKDRKRRDLLSRCYDLLEGEVERMLSPPKRTVRWMMGGPYHCASATQAYRRGHGQLTAHLIHTIVHERALEVFEARIPRPF